MSDTTVKVSLELLDKAAQKALTDLANKSDKADAAMDRVAKSSARVGKAAEDSNSIVDKLSETISKDLSDKGSESLGMLSKVFSGPVLGAIGLVATAVASLKASFNFTLQAERNEQIARSFNAMASSAGLAGDALKDGLVAASNGLADDEDILQAANKAIVEMGHNASVLPQTMEIARKATALFGGDLVQNFEALNSALASGNTRALRQFGIIIDSEDAQKKYAASIGTTKDLLTDAGQKQAIMNAALEAASTKFANVDESATKATQSYTRFKTQVGELGDSLAKTSQHSGFFATIFDALGKAAERTSNILKNNMNDGVDSLDARLALSRNEVDYYTKSIDTLQKRLAKSSGAEKEGLLAALDVAKQKLEAAKIEADETTKALGRLAKPPPNVETGDDKPNQVKSKELELSKQLVNSLYAEAVAGKAAHDQKVDQAREALDLEVANQQQILEAKRKTFTDQYAAEQEYLTAVRDANAAFREEQQKLAEEQFLKDSGRLEQSLAKDETDYQTYIVARDQLAKRYANEQVKRDNDEKKRTQELTKFKADQEKARGENLRSSLAYISSLQESGVKELFYVGKAAALATAYIDAQAAVVKALSAAPPPFNFALAGAVAAAAAVNISKIASAQFGQAGSVSAPSGGAPSAKEKKATRLDLQIAENERKQMNGDNSPELQAEIDRLKSERDKLAKDLEIERLRKEVSKFATGGIVGGTSYSGDQVSARVNSGEMVLTRSQQQQLFKLANGQDDANSSIGSKLDVLIASVRSLDSPIVVNIGGRTVVDVLRSELNAGRSFA